MNREVLQRVCGCHELTYPAMNEWREMVTFGDNGRL